MEHISSHLVPLSKQRHPFSKQAPPHPLSATVELIKQAYLFSGKYQRGYWLRIVSQYQKRHNIDPEAMYTRMIGMLKDIKSMDPKYSKGGWLTNRLKE